MCSRRSGYVAGADRPKYRSNRLICGIGNLKSLNDLARQARADYIIHTGDFGFYDESSLDRIADKYVLPCCSLAHAYLIV
jgi:hypothetical protein